MSDDSYFENEEDQESQDSNVVKTLRKQIKELEAKADKASKVDELERKLLIHESGLGNLKPKQVIALMRSHEGDWDAESLQATASELGFGKAESSDEGEESKLQISDEERRAHQINEQAAGRYVHRPDAEEELTAKIKATTSEDELIALLEANPRADGSSRLRQY